MTEESNTPQTNEQQTESPGDDKRFEVKWRKKQHSATTPVEIPQDASGAPTADVAQLERELETERQRVTELQDRWQRAAADLANFRKRTEQEKGDVQKLASMLLVQQLLPVLDNFDRALATIPGNLQMLTWIQGVMLIERHFRAILDRQGLEPVEAEGKPFSPHLHEAISERETPDAEPGTVLQVYQKGYSMHGRVIRPTLVELAKRPEVSAASPSPRDESRPREDEPERTDEAQAQEISEEAETENTGP